jgi:hypothetical protein
LSFFAFNCSVINCSVRSMLVASGTSCDVNTDHAVDSYSRQNYCALTQLQLQIKLQLWSIILICCVRKHWNRNSRNICPSISFLFLSFILSLFHTQPCHKNWVWHCVPAVLHCYQSQNCLHGCSLSLCWSGICAHCSASWPSDSLFTAMGTVEETLQHSRDIMTNSHHNTSHHHNLFLQDPF